MLQPTLLASFYPYMHFASLAAILLLLILLSGAARPLHDNFISISERPPSIIPGKSKCSTGHHRTAPPPIWTTQPHPTDQSVTGSDQTPNRRMAWSGQKI